MREFCLSLPDTAESEHFGEACFRVGKRLFASCGEKDGVCRLVFHLEPEHPVSSSLPITGLSRTHVRSTVSAWMRPA